MAGRRFNSEALVVPTVNGNDGTPLVKHGHSDQAVQSGGTYVGGTSWKLQYTIDGTNWIDIGAAITTPGDVRVIPNYATKVRAHMTTIGTGVPTAIWAGYEELWG